MNTGLPIASSVPVPIKELVPDVMGAKGIIGVPPEIVVDAIRKTAIDFATQTTIWRYYDYFNTQVNVSDYPIIVLEGTRVASMEWVAVNGNMLRANTGAVSPTFMRTLDPNSFYSWQGNGFTFTMDGRDVFYLTPVPISDGCCSQVTFCAALKPTQSSCDVPYIFAEDWRDAMTSGAAYRLFSMPRQDWTNSALAMVNNREYRNWIARARLTKSQNYTQAPLVMTGAYF